MLPQETAGIANIFYLLYIYLSPPVSCEPIEGSSYVLSSFGILGVIFDI